MIGYVIFVIFLIIVKAIIRKLGEAYWPSSNDAKSDEIHRIDKK
ncbi:MAG: hypothetical protein K0S80_3957 [Neobacillus sp.]|nr:hypothetical protein [Neobacillus sp.]